MKQVIEKEEHTAMNAINLQAENQQLRKELEALQQIADKRNLREEYEQHLVKQILEHASQCSVTDLPNVSSQHRPFGYFDGDLFLTARRPEGGMYALLGDFTGHGLAAAIGSMPVSEIFFTMARKSLSIGEMATEMNKTLNRLLPDSMFFAACLLEMDGKGDRVNLWSGGLNDIFLYEPSKKASRRLSSSHLPLGVEDEHSFDGSYSRLYCRRGDSFLIYTDGLVEARNPEGDEFGDDRLKAIFDRQPSDALGTVMGTFDAFTCDETQNDDITVAHIICQAI